MALSYYDVLQVPPNASEAEINESYSKLVSKYHPDKNSNDPAAEDKMKEINNAYDHLIDPCQRALYDAPTPRIGCESRTYGHNQAAASTPRNDSSAASPKPKDSCPDASPKPRGSRPATSSETKKPLWAAVFKTNPRTGAANTKENFGSDTEKYTSSTFGRRGGSKERKAEDEPLQTSTEKPLFYHGTTTISGFKRETFGLPKSWEKLTAYAAAIDMATYRLPVCPTRPLFPTENQLKEFQNKYGEYISYFIPGFASQLPHVPELPPALWDLKPPYGRVQYKPREIFDPWDQYKKGVKRHLMEYDIWRKELVDYLVMRRYALSRVKQSPLEYDGLRALVARTSLKPVKKKWKTCVAVQHDQVVSQYVKLARVLDAFYELNSMLKEALEDLKDD